MAVRWNKWTDIPVPDIGDWHPSLRLSVVIPFYERPDELNLTLAGLAGQTYPMELMEVLVVDDGSPNRPPRPPPALPFELKVLTQEDLGYGLARARNYGARTASGDVVVFLDCDMIPERQLLEAHARWHHSSSRLVSVGFRLHADFDGLDPEEVRAAVGRGDIQGLVPEAPVYRPEWVEAHMERTEEMLGPHDDFFSVMSGGNLAVDRDLYLDSGGTDESFDRWGGEDNELGFRLIQLGAVVVPERTARAWHQGHGHEPDDAEVASLRIQRPKMANLVPDRSLRSLSGGRIYTVPYVTTFIESGDEPAEVIGLTIDSILTGAFDDCAIGVEPASSSDDEIWLQEMYRHDPRVTISTSRDQLESLHRFAPVRMSIPAGFAVGVETLSSIVDHLGRLQLGALHITLPETSPREAMAHARLTRAVNRAVAVSPQRIDESIGDMFGERWVSGSSLGMWVIDDLLAARSTIINARFTKPSEETSHLESELTRLKERRAIRLADGLGALARARSWDEIRSALKATGRVLGRGPGEPSTEGGE